MGSLAPVPLVDPQTNPIGGELSWNIISGCTPAPAVDQGRFLSKSDLWLSLHRPHVLHQFLQASIFLLTHNVRSQKCEVESITSACSALDYFILPPLVIFSGKTVPLKVTGTFLLPIFLFVLPLFLVMRVLRQKLLVVWRLQLHKFIMWIVFGHCKVCLTVLR